MNHTTRRHPRTMREAFGPHTSHLISEKKPFDDWSGVWIAVVMAALVVVPYLIAWWRV